MDFSGGCVEIVGQDPSSRQSPSSRRSPPAHCDSHGILAALWPKRGPERSRCYRLLRHARAARRRQPWNEPNGAADWSQTASRCGNRSVIERSPPAIVIIAEVEDVSGTSLDRHRLGCGDIVDIGLGDHVIDRTAEVGIVDHMRLVWASENPIGGRCGAPQTSAEKRAQFVPAPAKCRLVESIRRTASSSLRRRPRVVIASICMKRPANTSGLRLRLRVRKGRTRRGDAARMIKPPLMALHGSVDVAQRAGAQQLINCLTKQWPS